MTSGEGGRSIRKREVRKHTWGKREITRGHFLGMAAAGAVGLAAGCAGTGQENQGPLVQANGPFDWKRFEGEEVTLLFNEHPWTVGLEPLIPEFERLTGMTVDLKTFSEDLYFDKMEQSLRAAQSVADLYFQPMDANAFNQWRADLIAPLTPFVESDSLTEKGYSVGDFPEELISPVRYPPGEPGAQDYGIPIAFETYILFYNKDLVEEYLGGEVPGSMEALIEAAGKITDQGNGDVYGSVMRGIRSDTIMDALTSVTMNSWGDEPTPLPYNLWFDGAWDRPRLTDPRIVEGVSNYARLLSAGPPNAQSLDWPDATTLFAQGKVAFFIDSSLFYPIFADPEQSRVVGKVGYAKIPSAGRGQLTGKWAWGLGIPSNSSNKEAAWLFLQWATNKQNTARIGKETGGAPRVSAFSDQQYASAFDAQYNEIVSNTLVNSRPTPVFNENWKEGALVLVDAMQAIADGEDPEQAMRRGDAQMTDVVGG